ncbi:hypothetical protein EJ06DRAFT_528941 [Trichodelitschia bisporula]|uniref:P-loop containing nucleoside triphosphate hydrolase protein n=1 Tax=Trichodelitschia bisporula TaxID=703511 RepID=A0A6G1I0E1_9PEZI|nr:hypothetical protein EJ06DRAFT_528941 [Trichodelitschia bisporula]
MATPPPPSQVGSALLQGNHMPGITSDAMPLHPLRSGYNLAMYIVKNVLGLDPSIVINLSIALAAITTFGRYIKNYVHRFLVQTIISQVHIHEDDALYQYVMKWMTDRHLERKVFRSVKANTMAKVTVEDDEAAFAAMTKTKLDMDKPISYRTMIGRSPIRFQPHSMSHIFIHRRNIFIFRHGVRSIPVTGHPLMAMGPRGNAFRNSGEITIEVLSRSLAPIKALLEEAQTYFLDKAIHTTTIFRGTGGMWMRISSRPSRGIDTVILEKAKKQALLRDINEYLHPNTRRWYANQGIPYRRGYLFSGPPGTGKTSLTSAIAGVFGLDIYYLSLLDQFVTEELFVRLFSTVPSRCIVLLEDIDSAGLKREKPNKRRKDYQGQQRITLSGLLNAIDGVSSSEGRILVMTTNHPEALDPALIRPGRIDMHVAFALPHRPEMEEMFCRMYRGLTDKAEERSKALTGTAVATSEDGAAEPEAASESKGKAEAEAEAEKKASHIPALCGFRPAPPPPSSEELQALAVAFAQALPEGKLSLAAIQGYLLKHKGDPREASKNAGAWWESEEADRIAKEEEEARAEAEEKKAAQRSEANGKEKKDGDEGVNGVSEGSGSETSDDASAIDSINFRNPGMFPIPIPRTADMAMG